MYISNENRSPPRQKNDESENPRLRYRSLSIQSEVSSTTEIIIPLTNSSSTIVSSKSSLLTTSDGETNSMKDEKEIRSTKKRRRLSTNNVPTDSITTRRSNKQAQKYNQLPTSERNQSSNLTPASSASIETVPLSGSTTCQPPMMSSISSSEFILLPESRSSLLDSCLHQIRLWCTSAREAIEKGFCVDRSYSNNLASLARRLASFAVSTKYNDSGLCSTPDLIAIEKITLSDIIPSIECFLTHVEALQLESLFSAVEEMKKKSVGKEALTCLVRGVFNILNTLGAVEMLTSIMTLPGTTLVQDYLSFEQLMESLLRFIRTTCLGLVVKSCDQLVAKPENRQVKKRVKRKISNSYSKDGETDAESDPLLYREWKTDLIRSIVIVLESLLRLFIIQHFAEPLNHQFISLVTDCLVVKCSDSPSSCLLLQFSASDALVTIASTFPKLRCYIEAFFIQQLVPRRLFDLIPSTSITRVNRSASHLLTSHVRLSCGDGIDLHPFTLTLLRLPNVFSFSDVSLPPVDLLTDLKQRVAMSSRFIRSVTKQLVLLCLIPVTSSAISKRNPGALSELKNNREVLRGILLDICKAMGSPLFPSAVLFVERFCLTLASIAQISPSPSDIWIEESCLILFSDVAKSLFTLHFTSSQSFIIIPDYCNDQVKTNKKTEAAASSIILSEQPICSRCRCIIDTNGDDTKFCSDCHQSYHLCCVDVDNKKTEESIDDCEENWLCECCLLRRTALLLYNSTNLKKENHQWVARHPLLLSTVGITDQCQADENISNELFLRFSSQNLIFAFILVHYVGQNPSKKDLRTVFSVKRGSVKGENQLLVEEQRWLLPTSIVIPPDHPTFTQSMMLCLLAKTFFPDEFNAMDSTSYNSGTQVTYDKSAVSTTASRQDKRREEYGDREIAEGTTEHAKNQIRRQLAIGFFNQNEFRTPTMTTSSLLSLYHQHSTYLTPLIHHHGIKTIWRQLMVEHSENARTIILAMLLRGVSSSQHASSRRAALYALTVCLTSDPSLLRHEALNTKPSHYYYISSGAAVQILYKLITALRDSAPRVRERGATAIEMCWNCAFNIIRNGNLIKVLVKKICAQFGICDHDIIQMNSFLNEDEILKFIQTVVSNDSLCIEESPHLHISAFGDVGRHDPGALSSLKDSENHTTDQLPQSNQYAVKKNIPSTFVNACHLLHFLVQFGLPQLARATSDVSSAVRTRAVKALGRILPQLPSDSPLLGLIASRLLHRLNVPGECPTVQLDICAIFNSIWLDPKLPTVKDFVQVENDFNRIQLPPPTDMDILVKILVTLSLPSSNAKSQITVPLESLVNSATRRKAPTNGCLKGGEAAAIGHSFLTKFVLDHSLPALSQILAVGAVTGTYTLKEADKCLASLTFRLFSLFLQRSTKVAIDQKGEEIISKTTAEYSTATSRISAAVEATSDNESSKNVSLDVCWSSSPLDIMKAIRILIEARPVALSRTFIKHLYPYLNQTPKTPVDAELLAELLRVISTSLSVKSKLHEITGSMKRETAELEMSIVKKLIPTGHPALVESAVHALASSVTTITRNFAGLIEPLFLDCLGILLPLRDLMINLELPANKHNCTAISSSQPIELLHYGLSLLTRHRAAQTADLNRPLERSCSTSLNGLNHSSSMLTTKIRIALDKPEQIKKQWTYVLESIKRRVWQLACLCRSLDFDMDLQYDLYDDDGEEDGEENLELNEKRNEDICLANASNTTKDPWEYKTPEPKKRRKTLKEKSDEVNSVSRRLREEEDGCHTPLPALKNEASEHKKSALDQILETVERASLNSQASYFALSRLVKSLLPKLLDEEQQIRQITSSINREASVSSSSQLCPSNIGQSLIYDKEIQLTNDSLSRDLQKCLSELDVHHYDSEFRGLPLSIDRLTVNFTLSIFELFLDLYQRFGLVRLQLITSSQEIELSKWLSTSLIALQALLLQSIGLFLQRQKTYVKSNRVRSVFASALISWESPRIQLSALKSISALLTQFEATAALSSDETFTDDVSRTTDTSNIPSKPMYSSNEISAQPLAFNNGKEIADIAKGFQIMENRDSTDNEKNSRNKKPVTIEIESVIKSMKGIRNSERNVLQSIALKVLGQLTKQGLVSPIAVSEPVFTLLFNNKEDLRDRSLEILKDGVEILSEEVLINNRLEELLNCSFAGLITSMIFDEYSSPNGSDTCNKCSNSNYDDENRLRCNDCRLPNIFVPSKWFQSHLLSFKQLYQDCLQSRRVSSERCLYHICSTLQHRIHSYQLKAISATVQQQLFPSSLLSKGCHCMTYHDVIRPLLLLNIPLDLCLNFIISNMFSRFITEILIALPYRLESEVLFVNYSLTLMLLKESTPFTAAEGAKGEIETGSPITVTLAGQNSEQLNSSLSDEISFESEMTVEHRQKPLTVGSLQCEYQQQEVELTKYLKMKVEDVVTQRKCIVRALEVATVCICAVATKKILKHHYQLNDEDCLNYNPLNTWAQLGSKEVITRRRSTEDDEICEENEALLIFEDKIWRDAVVELIQETHSNHYKNLDKNELTCAQIIQQIGKLIWPKLSDSFDVNPEKIDSIPRSLLSKLETTTRKTTSRKSKAKAKSKSNSRLNTNCSSKRSSKKRHHSSSDSDSSDSKMSTTNVRSPASLELSLLPKHSNSISKTRTTSRSRQKFI